MQNIDRLKATAGARQCTTPVSLAQFLVSHGVSVRKATSAVKISKSSFLRATKAVAKGRPAHRNGRPPLVEEKTRDKVVQMVKEASVELGEDLSEDRVLDLVCFLSFN